MSTFRYIAYGSNLLPSRLAARVEIRATLGVVELPGYALEFCKRGRDGSGKCTLVEHPHSVAFGAVYELARDDKQVLDRIEGVGAGYEERWVELADHGQSYLYYATPDFVDPDLIPWDWYKAFVVHGARHHGFPEPYVATLEAVAARRDPDDARRRENHALLGIGTRTGPAQR